MDKIDILIQQEKLLKDVLKVLKEVLRKLNGLTFAQNIILQNILYNIMLKNEEKQEVQNFLSIHQRSRITCINLGEFRIICEKLCDLIIISKDWSDDDRIHLESQITKIISAF